MASQVTAIVNEAMRKNILVAGICDASVYLGAIGLLNDLEHTSNTLEDMQGYIGEKYSGAKYYKKQQAVRSKNIITANEQRALNLQKRCC